MIILKVRIRDKIVMKFLKRTYVTKYFETEKVTLNNGYLNSLVCLGSQNVSAFIFFKWHKIVKLIVVYSLQVLA
jgi:hypothetical protein